MILMLCNTADQTRFSTETDCYVGYCGSRGVIYTARGRDWSRTTEALCTNCSIYTYWFIWDGSLFIISLFFLKKKFSCYVWNFLISYHKDDTFFFGCKYWTCFPDPVLWLLELREYNSLLLSVSRELRQWLTGRWGMWSLGPGHTFWTTEEFLECHAVPPTF